MKHEQIDLQQQYSLTNKTYNYNKKKLIRMKNRVYFQGNNANKMIHFETQIYKQEALSFAICIHNVHFRFREFIF